MDQTHPAPKARPESRLQGLGINRQFRAPQPNTLWVSDFTYVANWSGFVHVAFMINSNARRIVGWRERPG
jgi:transposase InsO family protein